MRSALNLLPIELTSNYKETFRRSEAIYAHIVLCIFIESICSLVQFCISWNLRKGELLRRISKCIEQFLVESHIFLSELFQSMVKLIEIPVQCTRFSRNQAAIES